MPILSEVGLPCAINPDRRLRRYAADVGWPVREFRNRRRNARRGATRPASPALAWAGGLVARAILRS